jgi:putative flippase GtrA
MKAVLARFSLAANRQFILYCIIGACGATLDFATFSLLIKWVGLPLQAANALGYCVGLVWSFCLNAFFNFKTRDLAVLRFLSFCGVSLLGWASSAGILHVAVQQLHWNQYLAKLIAIVVVVLLQYNLNRMLSFRKTPDAPKTG